jgi:hypothetical protein
MGYTFYFFGVALMLKKCGGPFLADKCDRICAAIVAIIKVLLVISLFSQVLR